MERPRLLLVPQLTELEWPIRSELERWADVAAFDAPGVGSTPPAPRFGREAIADEALAVLDRRGWQRCVLVADEFGSATAALIAHQRPGAVRAIALGHPCLSLRIGGERPSINAEVQKLLGRLVHTSYRMFARHLTQVTQGAYDDAVADAYVERVPMEISIAFYESMLDEEPPIGETLAELDVPLLFARHEGCLMFTPEGWEDAVMAFPHAEVVTTAQKPSGSPAFAEALRAFCAGL
ncbi:MAG: alpha/beta hydrolase [Actinobacteria bacterium]|nr:MAG: alpha/beta hydrolase [Actinomycetota bacterium]